MRKKVFLLADGEPMPAALLEKLRQGRFCVVLDGASEQARLAGWVPNRICGDFDSASPRTLEYFRRKRVKIVATPDQNHTDLEKALALSIREGAESLVIAQGLGRRLDHSLANLSFLKRFHHPRRELLLFTATEKVRFARDQKLTLRGKKGRGFAVIPFPACAVTSKGLAYELSRHKLELGVSESVSNRAVRAVVYLRIKGEALLIEEL